MLPALRHKMPIGPNMQTILPRALLIATCLFATSACAGSPEGSDSRIFDVHLHAFPLDAFPNGPPSICTGQVEFPGHDPRVPLTFEDISKCDHAVPPANSNEDLMAKTLKYLEQLNIKGIVNGPLPLVTQWRAAMPDRIIPAMWFDSPEKIDVALLERAIANGEVKVLGELGFQYSGYAPDAQELEPIFALAERLDTPVALHMGLGMPAARYVGIGQEAYRVALGDPLLLEPVLIRHPKMRFYVMHGGWPLLDKMIAVMYAHPQVYVDTGFIAYALPREEFHQYMQGFFRAGLGKRVMFGSDQAAWPDAIPIAIDAIRSAPFLSEEQKRDVFYNNAARFFRLP